MKHLNNKVAVVTGGSSGISPLSEALPRAYFVFPLALFIFLPSPPPSPRWERERFVRPLDSLSRGERAGGEGVLLVSICG